MTELRAVCLANSSFSDCKERISVSKSAWRNKQKDRLCRSFFNENQQKPLRTVKPSPMGKGTTLWWMRRSPTEKQSVLPKEPSPLSRFFSLRQYGHGRLLCNLLKKLQKKKGQFLGALPQTLRPFEKGRSKLYCLGSRGKTPVFQKNVPFFASFFLFVRFFCVFLKKNPKKSQKRLTKCKR